MDNLTEAVNMVLRDIKQHGMTQKEFSLAVFGTPRGLHWRAQNPGRWRIAEFVYMARLLNWDEDKIAAFLDCFFADLEGTAL